MGKGIAGSEEKITEPVYVLAAFDAILNAPRERNITDENGKSRITPELCAKIEGTDLALA
jgi:hypothetical protein